MNNDDIERFAQLLEYRSRMLNAEIELQSMVAENKQREIEGYSMAFVENDFISLINKHSIGVNDFPYGGVKR